MADRKLRRKTVTVTFSGDDDAVHHIIDSQDKKAPAKSARSRRKSCPVARKTKEVEEENDSDEENIPFGKSTALEEDSSVFGGGDVYRFKSPKKSGSMAQLASESRTPKSILKTPIVREETPKKAVNFTPSEEGPRTPRNSTRALRERKPAATTPYRLHKRQAAGDSDESDDSLDSSEDESEDEGRGRRSTSTTPSAKGTSKSSSTPATPSRRKRPADDFNMPTGVEEYFDIHAAGAGPTSDMTLAKLDVPRMDQKTLADVLASVPASHTHECQQMYQDHRQLFKDWMFKMCTGFNILLYGLGSKRNLLEDFRHSMLKDFSHIVVNGYFPSLMVKQILNNITEDILGHTGSFKGPLDQCEFIKESFENSGEDFYLLIHSIDGGMLRNEKSQNILSLLAQVPGIHILASVDHINSSLVWDQSQCCRFSWLWYDVTTYAAYSEETSYENSLLVQQTGALALSSLTHVMKSLTPNAKGIFLLLAQYQLENKDNANYIGMSMQDLYQRCRESFLVNSDLTLQAQLTEFRDHKMIRSKKSYDGVEHLHIPIDAGTLTEFVSQHKDT